MEPKGSQMELKWSQKGAGMERGPSQETPAAVTLLVKLLLSVARRQDTDTSSCNTASEAASGTAPAEFVHNLHLPICTSDVGTFSLAPLPS